MKSPENPKIFAEKELELQAKRKAQESAKQSQLVQEDLDRRQLGARERTQGIQEKLQSIPDPIHLAGCHTLSKVNNFIPFPSETISSTALSCFDQHQAQMVLSNRDPLLADYLATLLSDSTDNLREMWVIDSNINSPSKSNKQINIETKESEENLLISHHSDSEDNENDCKNDVSCD
uniref:Uncharacterized protein n=1 Tax=Meloidogyne javanica TaxID=6303 RepID=A0A915M9W9_MELJA